MPIAIAIFITIGLAVFVAYPLLSARAENQGLLPIEVTPLGDLKRRRLQLYENIQDLDFEFRANKIARDDYESLRESYTTEAARLMEASREIQHASAEDALIEREVAWRRSHRPVVSRKEYVCPKCGFENALPVKFCGECGARLEKNARSEKKK
jgi:rubrerythrin